MSLAIIAFLVLRQSNSTSAVENPLCYAQCLTCLYGGPWVSAICSGFCAANCMAGSTSLRSVPKDNHYFCKLGCASSLCASFITRENPGIQYFQGFKSFTSLFCTDLFNFLSINLSSLLRAEIAKVGVCADSCSEKCSKMNTLPLNYKKDQGGLVD